MADALELSVLVTSFNQLAQLKRLLPQLLAQDVPRESFEIIVVDDGSTDGSREWLQTQTNQLVLLLNAANLGRAASRNRGIQSAQGRILVMIDGDHTIAGDFLRAHSAAHALERCVIVGKSVFVDHPDARALNHYLNYAGAAKLPYRTKLPGRYFLTRNCSLPRELLNSVGCFDQRFVHWGGEDLDLGLRLEATGVPIYGEPAALAIHDHVRLLEELLQNLYVYGRDGIPLLLQKHPQLYRELNLDHVIKLPDLQGRYGALHRGLFRFAFLRPFYYGVYLLAKTLRRFRLPRAVFDYLHLRTYSRGFCDSLSAQSQP